MESGDRRVRVDADEALDRDDGDDGATSDVDGVLDDVARARSELADRVAAPWWYRLGAAASTMSIFVGLGFTVGGAGMPTDDLTGMVVVVLGAVIGPALLLTALKNATGVSLDRYASGLGGWYVTVFGLVVAGFVLQVHADVPLALPVAGVIAFGATLVSERRIDALLRRRIRGGPVAA